MGSSRCRLLPKTRHTGSHRNRLVVITVRDGLSLVSSEYDCKRVGKANQARNGYRRSPPARLKVAPGVFVSIAPRESARSAVSCVPPNEPEHIAQAFRRGLPQMRAIARAVVNQQHTEIVRRQRAVRRSRQKNCSCGTVIRCCLRAGDFVDPAH